MADERKTDEFSLLLDGKGGATPLPDNKAVVLQKGQCCFWQNLDYKDPQVFEILTKDYHLDPTIAEALCDDETRPRFFTQDNGMVLILRAVNFNKGSDVEDMISVRIWADEEKIITLSHRFVPAANKLKEIKKKKKGPHSSVGCLIEIINALSDEINEVIENINDSSDDLEEEVVDVDNLTDFQLRGKLSGLRRQIIVLRRYIAPQKEIFQNLYNQKSPLITAKAKVRIREIYNTVTKAVEDLDTTRDRLAVFHEELQSKMSINMSKIMYMISIVTVVFLPLGLITSLLGINVNGIPFAESPWAFLGVCIFLLLLCLILFTIMRRLKWL